MDQLWNVLLGNSVVAGVLGLLAAVAMRVFRRPAMAHALWLVALVKLITPPIWTVSVPWIAVSSEQAAPATRAVVHSRHVVDDERVSSEVDRGAVIEAGMISDGEALSVMPSPSAQSSVARGPVVSLESVLITAWLAGAFVATGVFVAHLRRLRRLLKHSIVSSPELV